MKFPYPCPPLSNCLSPHLRPASLYHVRALVHPTMACPALPPLSRHSRRHKACRVRVARSTRAVSGQATATDKHRVSLCCLPMSWFTLWRLWLTGTRLPSQGKGHRRGGSSGQRPHSPYRLQPLRVDVKVIIGSLDRDWRVGCGRRSARLPAPSRRCTHGCWGTSPWQRRERGGW